MSSRKRRILIVDDEAPVARTLKLNLDGTERFDACVETRGRQVVDTAHRFEPDLILLDVVMPDLSGHEVLRQLRDDERLKKTPVLFLSATPPGTADDSLQPDAWIAKPLSVSEIIGHIERRLGV